MEIQYSLYASFSQVCIKTFVNVNVVALYFGHFSYPLFCVLLYCRINGHVPDTIKSFSTGLLIEDSLKI